MAGDDGDIEPETHLITRYEEMVDIQIQTIDGIDEKAAQTGQLIALLAGLILTATSIVATTDVLSVQDVNGMAIAMFGLGGLSLFLAFLAAIIAYLSSKFRYGPPSGIGPFVATAAVDKEDYLEALLVGYSKAIADNKRVIERNADRFRWCLLFLTISLLYLFGSSILLALPDVPFLDITVLGLTTLASSVLFVYMYRKEHLTLNDVG